MLDIRLIRKDPEKVRKNIERRHKQAYLENFDKLIFVDLELRKSSRSLTQKGQSTTSSQEG
jgi:Seryl-tRNA synthetase N-terminal domain.